MQASSPLPSWPTHDSSPSRQYERRNSRSPDTHQPPRTLTAHTLPQKVHPTPPTATPCAPPPGLLHAPHPTSHVTYTSHATLLTCGFYPGTCVTIASTVATELRTAITTHFAHSKGRWGIDGKTAVHTQITCARQEEY